MGIISSLNSLLICVHWLASYPIFFNLRLLVRGLEFSILQGLSKLLIRRRGSLPSVMLEDQELSNLNGSPFHRGGTYSDIGRHRHKHQDEYMLARLGKKQILKVRFE